MVRGEETELHGAVEGDGRCRMGCLLEDSYVQSFVMGWNGWVSEGWMVGGSFCVNRSFFSVHLRQ